MDKTALFTQYLIFLLILSIIFGIFAQVSRFCLAGGFRDHLAGINSHRLWAYVVAIVVAILGAAVIEVNGMVNLNDTRTPYRSAHFVYGRYILGGLIFGFGMMLASGCGLRNLIRFGSGSYKALVILTVMALTAYAMINMSVYSEIFLPIVEPFSLHFSETGSQDIIALLASIVDYKYMRIIFAVLLFVIILYFALKDNTMRQAKYLVSSFVIGLIVVAGFVISGGEMGQLVIEEAEFMIDPPRGLGTQSFSFASPMADTVYALLYTEGMGVITFGVVAMIGIPSGAFLASLFRKEFKFSGFTNAKDFIISMTGAILVGIGSVLAMGCSIGHGLTGLSTLALGSILSMLFILLGAYLGLKVLKILQ